MGREYRQPYAKKRRTIGRRYQGLTPTYRGWNPRMFTKGEWKYNDEALTASVCTAGNQILLNGIAPGSSANQRIGMKIAIRSLEIRGYVRVTTVTGVDQTIRWNVFMDKQANAADPSIGSHLGSNSVNGLRSLTQRKRFKIIIDKQYTLNGVGEGGSIRRFYHYIKFRRPIVAEYNAGTDGDIGDIVSNSLFFYQVGSEASGNTEALMYGNARIRYTDM